MSINKLSLIHHEIELDQSDLNLLKARAPLIDELFKTKIETNVLSRAKPESSVKNIICLIGTKADVEITKRYINALLRPEIRIFMESSGKLGEKLRSRVNMNQLIQDYQVNLEILDESKFEICGRIDDVRKVKELIEAKIKSCSENSSKISKNTTANIPSKDCDSDSIICLDDPYEAFDEDDEKVHSTNEGKTAVKTNDFLQNFNEDSVIILDNTEVYKNSAVAQGFTFKQVDQAFNELKDVETMSEDQFMNFLKNRFKMKDSSCSTESENKSGLNIEENHKKMLKSNNQSTPIANKQFTEYTKMFESQKFDPKHEEQNKIGRIGTLLQAMPDEKMKMEALSQVIKYKTNKDNRQSRKIRTNEIIDVDDGTDNIEECENVTSVLMMDDECVAKQKENSKKIDESILLGYDTMMANESSILVGYETMMMDEQPISSKETRDSRSSKIVDQNNSNLTKKQHHNNLSSIGIIARNGDGGSWNDPKSKSNKTKFRDEQQSISSGNEFSGSESIMSTSKSLKQNHIINSGNSAIGNKTNNENKGQLTSGINQVQLRPSESIASSSKTNNLINTSTEKRERKDGDTYMADHSDVELSDLDNAMKNISTQHDQIQNSNLRYIIIDGSNVARDHGQQKFGQSVFSCQGIKIVVDYFLRRGHSNVKAFVPRFRRGQSDKKCPTYNGEILDELEKNNNLIYTPSRYVGNQLIYSYDDRFILKAAQHYDAIIVSNDNYRDLMKENFEWQKLVRSNLLQYSFIGDLFMIADDPFGKNGPNIEEFLSSKKNNFTSANNNQWSKNQQSQYSYYQHNQNFAQPKSSSSVNNHSHSSGNFSGMTAFNKQSFSSNQFKQQYQNSQYHNKIDPKVRTGSFSNLSSNSSNDLSQNSNTKSLTGQTEYAGYWSTLSKPRDMSETSSLYDKLIDIFPNSDAKIKSLLNSNQDNKDLMFFIEKCCEETDIK